MLNKAAFFDTIRPMFGGTLSQDQVTRIEPVLDGLIDRRVITSQAAYILATAFHESDRFKTLEEYASGRDYEGRKSLGNTVKGDGVRFKGRGYVQITGRRNYTDWAKRLGAPLVNKPSLASEIENAVPILIDGMIMGTFTGRKLGDYVNTNQSDFKNARRVVNGTDKAEMISGYASKFLAALIKAEYLKPAPSSPQPAPDNGEPAPPSKLMAAILSIIKAIFNRKA